MSFLRSETSTFTTNSSGEATVYSANLNGKVHSVEFLPGSPHPSSATAVTITGENSSRQILTVAALSSSPGIWYPRAPSHRSTSGSTFGAEGVQIPVVAERVKYVVTAGGNGLSGAFRMTVE